MDWGESVCVVAWVCLGKCTCVEITLGVGVCVCMLCEYKVHGFDVGFDY